MHLGIVTSLQENKFLIVMIQLTLFLLLCLSLPAYTLGDALSPDNLPAEFRAEYVAEYRGLPVRARGIRELIRLEDGRYRLTSSAKSMFIKISETSEFVLDGDTLLPADYQYTRTGIGKNKSESSHFNWEDGELLANGETFELSDSAFDKLSYQYQLQRDVAEAIQSGKVQEVLEYTVTDEANSKQYRFEIVGKEAIDTPLGELMTVRVDRIREGSDRQTSFWLAVDHEFLLVRLEQIEDDKGFELNLDAATINGVALPEV